MNTLSLHHEPKWQEHPKTNTIYVSCSLSIYMNAYFNLLGEAFCDQNIKIHVTRDVICHRWPWINSWWITSYTLHSEGRKGEYHVQKHCHFRFCVRLWCRQVIVLECTCWCESFVGQQVGLCGALCTSWVLSSKPSSQQPTFYVVNSWWNLTHQHCIPDLFEYPCKSPSLHDILEQCLGSFCLPKNQG